jgi:hypothetical protein
MGNPTTYNGRGSQLLYSLDQVNYTPVAQLTEFKHGGSEQNFVDQTNLATPDNFDRPYPTRIKAGEITFAGVLDPGDLTYLTLQQFHANLTLVNWRIILVDGSIYAYAAYVSHFVFWEVKVSRAYRFSGTLRIVGGMTSPQTAFQPSAFQEDAFQIVKV